MQINNDAVLEWLEQRLGHELNPGMNLESGLELDSLGLFDLICALEERFNISITEDDLADLITVGELANRANLERQIRTRSAESPQLAPPLLHITWVRKGVMIWQRAMRHFFMMIVEGDDRIPHHRPLIICPNHASYLDPFLLAAVLPIGLLERTYWSGWTEVVFNKKWKRQFSRIARIIPLGRGGSAVRGLRLCQLALAQKYNLVWFPEGPRTRDGQLQAFRPGIGVLVEDIYPLIVPVYIKGSFSAWPPHNKFFRRRPIKIKFGVPISSDAFPTSFAKERRRRALADQLRDAVVMLSSD
jgi:long-chain acyl-CoA synthetase